MVSIGERESELREQLEAMHTELEDARAARDVAEAARQQAVHMEQLRLLIASSNPCQPSGHPP